MKKVVLVSALLLSFGSVQAAESPRWDRASISYQLVDIEDDQLAGFGISGSKLLGEDFFVVGSYLNASDFIEIDMFGSSSVDTDFNTLSVGLGYRYAISQKSDFFGVVSYEDVEVKKSYQGNSESNSAAN